MGLVILVTAGSSDSAVVSVFIGFVVMMASVEEVSKSSSSMLQSAVFIYHTS